MVNCVTGFLAVVTTVVTGGNGQYRRLVEIVPPARVVPDSRDVRDGSPAATMLLVVTGSGGNMPDNSHGALLKNEGAGFG